MSESGLNPALADVTDDEIQDTLEQQYERGEALNPEFVWELLNRNIAETQAELHRLQAVVEAVRPYMTLLPVDVAEGIIGIEPIDHVDQERTRMRAALADISRVVMPDVGHGGNYGFVVTATEAAVGQRDRLRLVDEAAAKLVDARIEGESDREELAWVALGNALAKVPRRASVSEWWESPIDGHRHAHGPRPDDCAVCAVAYERDRLQAMAGHLRESAQRAIGQDRDDQYDEGNRDAWVYVLNVLDGKAGT